LDNYEYSFSTLSSKVGMPIGLSSPFPSLYRILSSEFSYFIGTMTTLRLLLSHPTALRFLRLAVPSLFSLFALPIAENMP